MAHHPDYTLNTPGALPEYGNDTAATQEEYWGSSQYTQPLSYPAQDYPQLFQFQTIPQPEPQVPPVDVHGGDSLCGTCSEPFSGQGAEIQLDELAERVPCSKCSGEGKYLASKEEIMKCKICPGPEWDIRRRDGRCRRCGDDAVLVIRRIWKDCEDCEGGDITFVLTRYRRCFGSDTRSGYIAHKELARDEAEEQQHQSDRDKPRHHDQRHGDREEPQGRSHRHEARHHDMARREPDRHATPQRRETRHRRR